MTTYRYEPLHTSYLRAVTAYDGETQVGQLTWFTKHDQSVFRFEVDPDRQGQGIGLRIFAYARSDAVPKEERPARTRPTDKRSESGEAFYRKTRARPESPERTEEV